MNTKSKFAALLASRQAEPLEEPPASEAVVATGAQVTLESQTWPEVVKRPRGRPGGQGKRSNPVYTQVTAYIPEDLHVRTKINLLRRGKREFSELVEELLAEWNRAQAKSE